MIRVAWHLGLGDTISCAAIIAKLAEPGEETFVPCWKHNEQDVKTFFVDLPNVKIFPVENDNDFHEYDIRLGFYNKDLPQYVDEDFVEWFYRQAGMTVIDKTKYCPLEKASVHFDTGRIYEEEEYKFIHDDRGRGFEIKDIKGFKPYGRENYILSFAGSIKHAAEVHCIDSSFYHLCEALPTTGKLFYHKYARPNSTKFNSIKNWTVIE